MDTQVKPGQPADIVVRPLEATDLASWTLLWQGYQELYQVALTDAVTAHLWRELCAATAGRVHGFGAIVNGELVGIVHYLFHASTWSETGYCYLEDLFTTGVARTLGVGRALIAAVVEAAELAGMGKVYWQTQETNAVARALYDRVATRPGFLIYEIPTV